jgi:hypothetical protein
MNTSQRSGASGDTGQRRRRWWQVWRLALLPMLALLGIGGWVPASVVQAAPNVKVRPYRLWFDHDRNAFLTGICSI